MRCRVKIRREIKYQVPNPPEEEDQLTKTSQSKP